MTLTTQEKILLQRYKTNPETLNPAELDVIANHLYFTRRPGRPPAVEYPVMSKRKKREAASRERRIAPAHLKTAEIDPRTGILVQQ